MGLAISPTNTGADFTHRHSSGTGIYRLSIGKHVPDYSKVIGLWVADYYMLHCVQNSRWSCWNLIFWASSSTTCFPAIEDWSVTREEQLVGLPMGPPSHRCVNTTEWLYYWVAEAGEHAADDAHNFAARLQLYRRTTTSFHGLPNQPICPGHVRFGCVSIVSR